MTDRSRMPPRVLLRAASAVAALFLVAPAFAEAPCRNTGEFSRWLADFRKEAAAEGISAKAIAALDGITLDQSVLNRDRGQGIFSTPFLQFSDRLISNNRLQKGRDLLDQNRATLDRIEQDFGVPPGVIVAF